MKKDKHAHDISAYIYNNQIKPWSLNRPMKCKQPKLLNSNATLIEIDSLVNVILPPRARSDYYFNQVSYEMESSSF